MVIVSTILYVDMLRFANSFSAQLNDFIILVINWIFCIFVFIINLAIAIYGFVCGCCYSKEFEKIIQNEQPKSAFSFTTSNKVLFSLDNPDIKVGWVFLMVICLKSPGDSRDDGLQEDAPHFTELLGLILISDISNI